MAEQAPENPASMSREFYIHKARTKKAQAAANKVNALPEDIPIYVYGGHGVDVCNSYTHEPIIVEVPDNCIYITLTECGLVAYYNEKLQELFSNPSPDVRELLRKPYLFQNLLKISKISGIPFNSFHVHYPGMKFVVSNLEPFAYFHLRNAIALGVSGLSEKSKMENIYDKLKFISKIKKTIYDVIFSAGDLGDFTKTKIIEALKKADFKDKRVKKIIETSDLEKQFDAVFPGKEKIYGYQINQLLEEIITVVSRDEILDRYSASVLPTQDSVKELLDTQYPGKEYFNYVDLQNLSTSILEKVNGRKSFIFSNATLPLTNYRLMKAYPGIHYNLVCRSVSPECMPRAILQRRGSMNREMIRRDVLASRRLNQKYYADLEKLKEKPSLEGVRLFLVEQKPHIDTLSPDGRLELLKDIEKILDYPSLENPTLVFSEIYDSVFPLKDSYTAPEILETVIQDDKLKTKIDIPYDLYTRIVKNLPIRYKTYYERLDKDSFQKLSYAEKQGIYSNLIHHGYLYYLNDDTIRDALEALLVPPYKSAPAPKSAAPPKSARAPKSSAPSKSKVVVLRKIYQDMVKRVDSVVQREYPKAKNAANALRTKQIALYNSLLSISDELKKLTEDERVHLIDYLVEKGMILSGAKEPIISKKLRYLVWPEKYPNPLAGGHTRKNRKRASRKTRKAN